MDHRHRHRLLARRGSRRALAGAAGQARQRRHRRLRALHRASDGQGVIRRADSQEGRSAPDGSLAAHRHLRRGPRARQRGHQGQHRDPLAHGHDRRCRRRRARPCGGLGDPERSGAGQRSPWLSQRAADERAAADTVSRPALQPARRQHRHRPWRHRLLAHLHGRGSRRRRCRAHRPRPYRGGPERYRIGRRGAERRAQGSADALRVRQFQPQGQVQPDLGTR